MFQKFIKLKNKYPNGLADKKNIINDNLSLAINKTLTN